MPGDGNTVTTVPKLQKLISETKTKRVLQHKKQATETSTPTPNPTNRADADAEPNELNRRRRRRGIGFTFHSLNTIKIVCVVRVI